MILRLLWSLIKLPFKLIVGAYRLIKRLRSRRTAKKDFPGIYIVSNHPSTIKIGRSKHVLRRLKQYRGYQFDGRDIPRLLVLKCKRDVLLEKRLHKFATAQGLVRLQGTEVFACSDKQEFIQRVLEFVKSRHLGL